MVSLAGASIMWLLVVNRDASESGATMPTQYATKDAVAPAAYAPHVEPIPPLGKPPGSIVIEPTPFPVAAPDSPSPGDAKNGAETSTPRESPLPIAPAGSAQETSVLASTESQVKPVPVIIQKVPTPPTPKTAVPTRKVEHGHREPTTLTKENADKKDKDPPPKAVILDTTRAPDPPKPTNPVGQAPVVPPDAKGQKLVGPAREVAAISGGTEVKVTVVDIASDNSFVLISNPQTRLPQKFVVGQKIFTGETIQKIDAQQGQVQLNGRSIGMK